MMHKERWTQNHPHVRGEEIDNNACMLVANKHKTKRTERKRVTGTGNNAATHGRKL